MTQIRLSPFLIVFGFFFIFSCKQKQHNPTDKKYSPVLQIKDSASKYYVIITNETITETTVRGKEINSTNTSTAGLIYTLQKDSVGGYTLQITYDSLQVVSQSGDKKTVMDAAGAALSLNPSERLLAGIKGASIFVQLNDKGKIIAVNGYKEIANKILAKIDIPTEADRQKMQQQLYDMLGEGFVKNNLQEGFGIFPDTAVYVGDSWSKKSTQVNIMQLDVNTTYTLAEVEENVATVKSSAQVAGNGISGAGVLNNQPAGSLNGKGSGSYKINMQTGMLTQEESDMYIEGKLQVNGIEVPLNVRITKTISSRKL